MSFSVDEKIINQWNVQKVNQSPEEILSWLLDFFGRDSVVLASSLGVEDQVLTHMILEIDKKARIFTIETGRLHSETLQTMQKTMQRYNFQYEVLTPEAERVKQMVAEHGRDLFYESKEKRQLCCRIRKVEPLTQLLSSGVKAWICGLRSEQSNSRAGVQKIEWDAQNGLLKINPLAEWTQTQVWDYIRKHQIPYNPLHDRGFPSIGCEPCTRAVKPGEDFRAGRWWWEEESQKECGLHSHAKTAVAK